MKRTALFVIGVHNIVIPEELGRGERLDDDFYLTNNCTSITKNFERECVRLRKAIGTLGYRDIFEAPLIAYRTVKHDGELNEANSALNRQSVAWSNSDRLAFLCQIAMWLIKDNACFATPAYLVTDDVITPHDPYSVCSTADGKQSLCQFSRSEFRRAREIFSKVRIHSEGSQRNATKSPSSKQHSRLSRGVHFVSAARLRPHCMVKVATYFTALEALLLTSEKSVKEQLAVRVAMLLGSDTLERRQFYDRVRQAYEIRCQLVHGKSFTDEKLAVDSAAFLDDILRKLLLMLHNQESLASKKLTEESEWARLLHELDESWRRIVI